MAHEVERKFLVTRTDWKTGAVGVHVRQGYLSLLKERTVRVRTGGERATLTIKGLTVGVSRLEFEYDIPLPDANAMLDELCERPLIEKTRYRIASGRHTWEIDEFHGENEGLTIAEIELSSAVEPFDRPAWLGPEVSHDPRYFNVNLVQRPYRAWGSTLSGSP